MSGGVDSSVAAALLKRRGHEVVGVTLQIWQESQTDPRHAGCCSLGAVEDARRVARLLEIPHYVFNMRDEFRESVIANFVEEYSAGRTPNPCVQCNRHIKFDLLCAKMRELGCSRLATGHYARVRREPRTGRYSLLTARGKSKDQSYVLYMMTQEQLSHAVFPLGELADKERTRDLARSEGLPVSEKPDSQEICFVSEAGGYREFLRARRPETFRQGEVVDESGRVLARHSGVADFTIGQRKGVLAGAAAGRPLYVLRLEPESNRVVVGPVEGLERCEVRFSYPVWGVLTPERCPARVKAKIRYNMEPRPATLYSDPTPLVVFDAPVRAVSPGQIVVAYVGARVAVGGTIV
jgi:tRNA-specific 2-thiouridylase